MTLLTNGKILNGLAKAAEIIRNDEVIPTVTETEQVITTETVRFDKNKL